jgi:quercetin dioxygenase-like cupin family protein
MQAPPTEEEEPWPFNRRRESGAPTSSGTISAFPDTRSQNRVDIGPEAPFVQHKHPGEELIYLLEGSLEYHVEGEPPTSAG